MEYFTLALRVPSGVTVASTLTRCVEEKGSSPEIVFQQDAWKQGGDEDTDRSSAFLPRRSGRITPRGATSKFGSAYTVRFPSSTATRSCVKRDGRGSNFSGASD